jgi:membrane fusion protein
VSFSVLTLFFVTIVAAVCTFLFGFSFAHKVQVTGVVLPREGAIRAVATQAGVVSQVRVREGDAVKASQVLFVMTNERVSASGDDASQTISRLLETRRNSLAHEVVEQREQANQRIASIGRRIDSLTIDRARIENQIALQMRRIQLAEDSLRRFTELQASNFVSPAQVQDRTADLIDQRQRLGDLERTRETTLRDLESARADMTDLELQRKRDIAASERSATALEQELVENESKRELHVRAPQEGIVTAITVQRGQSVGLGQSLGTLLPTASPLEAEIYAPSRSIGFVKPGMEVLLRYQAYPYQKFGQHRGKVREVSSAPIRADEIALPASGTSGTSEPMYRIRVDLENQVVLAYGDARPLRPGMALDATIVVERRKIFEWLFEPLYSVAAKI